MAKINILDSSIFNLISAGEVVDKPASVVKELVENSIDAGSTDIKVEIKGGGIDFIRVTDNGCGIEKSEMPKAFMPHATSKISCVDDLNSILTLGFRGEALASIAAVAKVTLISRIEEEELGYAMIYEGGKLVAEYECGCKKGTVVTVENIFEKIPARQKYLSSPSREEADITNLITRLILSNPSISFGYESETKKLSSTGENEKSALVAVYGNDILSNMEEVSLVMPDITIKGFVGKPSYSKYSRNYQTLVVNGRYIKNEDISFLVYLCYKDFLMTRQYPVFLLYIDLPADMVDVNVHPNKMDVKFVQADRIKKLIRSLVNSKLNKIALSPKTIEKSVEASEDKTFYGSTFSANGIFKNKSTFSANNIFTSGSGLRERHEPHISGSGASAFPYGAKANNNVPDYVNNDFLLDETYTTVGTLFSTYIIAEKGEFCYLIDQHAAHERMLYDKLVKELDSGKPLIQELLLPYEFELTGDESVILKENIGIFEQCGFKISKDGQKFIIKAVPAIVSGISLAKFLPIFFDAIKLDSLKNSTLIKDILAQSACKAAVKGDRLLSAGEIKYLIDGINKLDALLCPHGRPIVIKLSKIEIDKWFKRK